MRKRAAATVRLAAALLFVRVRRIFSVVLVLAPDRLTRPGFWFRRCIGFSRAGRVVPFPRLLNRRISATETDPVSMRCRRAAPFFRLCTRLRCLAREMARQQARFRFFALRLSSLWCSSVGKILSADACPVVFPGSLCRVCCHMGALRSCRDGFGRTIHRKISC